MSALFTKKFHQREQLFRKIHTTKLFKPRGGLRSRNLINFDEKMCSRCVCNEISTLLIAVLLRRERREPGCLEYQRREIKEQYRGK